MTKEEIIKSIVCDVKDYRFTHDELMRMSKKELLQYYPQFNSEKTNNHLEDEDEMDMYKRGVRDMWEQMMKGAVEGVVIQWAEHYMPEICCGVPFGMEAKHGDKVKVIVIKEEKK